MSRFFAWILLAALSGITCAAIAKKKGRDAGLWFMSGILFNLFAVATISFVNEKIKKERRVYHEDDYGD